MNAETCLEYFRQKVANKDRSEFHIVDHTKALKDRVINAGPKPKTRVQFETDDPEFYSAFNAEKDRIITRARNKTLGLHMLLVAWRRLDNATIDRLLAEEEGEPT
jgi:hypothetical protein